MNEWNVDWVRDMAKNGGRFGSKRVREAVYKNNCTIFHRWAYPIGGGIERSLGERNAFLNGTKVYARELDVSDIRPILEKPSGTAVTGFIAESDECAHILVFREFTDKNTAEIAFAGAMKKVELILY